MAITMSKAQKPQTASRFRIPWLPGQHPKAGKDNTYPFRATTGNGVMSLADIIGTTAAKQVEASNQLTFHSVGDTGRGPHTPQQDAAEAMARDVDPKKHATSPAFLFHLGDVIYGDGKEYLYDIDCSRPYADYPKKFMEIPENHEGEVGIPVDTTSLGACEDNFCSPSGTEPPLAKTFNNEMVHQPG